MNAVAAIEIEATNTTQVPISCGPHWAPLTFADFVMETAAMDRESDALVIWIDGFNEDLIEAHVDAIDEAARELGSDRGVGEVCRTEWCDDHLVVIEDEYASHEARLGRLV